MNKKLKILSLLLALITVISSLTILTACGSASKLNFELNKDGTGYVCLGFKEENTASELEIPAEVKGLPVVEVGFNSFNGNKDLTKVVIPDSVVKIGVSAFKNCSNIVEISLPSKLEQIEKTAFYKTAIKELVIPDNVKNIGESAFEGCEKLESVSLGSSMERVQDFAFSGCTALSQLDLGKGLKCIKKCAFENCTALTEITLPESLEMIYGWAFDGCDNVTKFTFKNTVGWMNSEEYSQANKHMHPNPDLPSLTDPVENVKHFITGTGGTYCAWRGAQPEEYPNPYVPSIELLWYTCDTKDKWA